MCCSAFSQKCSVVLFLALKCPELAILVFHKDLPSSSIKGSFRLEVLSARFSTQGSSTLELHEKRGIVRLRVEPHVQLHIPNGLLQLRAVKTANLAAKHLLNLSLYRVLI